MVNALKTGTLLAFLGALFIGIGAALGGSAGMVIGLVLGLAFAGGSYWFSDKLAIAAARAKPITREDSPELYAMVEDLAQRNDMPMPRLYLSAEAQPNAFATGRGPKNAAVCCTQGILQVLDRDELRGVLAHELSHVKNRDILIGSVAAAVATGISFVANMALFAGMFGGGDDEDGPSPAVALLMAILAPVAASVLQMALSRSREFEADRVGAAIAGDPEPLARALERLDRVARVTPFDIAPAQASAYIVNPLTGRTVTFARLFLTHPPVEERVERLRSMADRIPQVG